MKKQRRHPIIRTLQWLILVGLACTVALLFYCASLFQELEPIMAQTLRSQPSVIYSDLYVVKKGDNYVDTFLTERLKELRIPFTESPGSVQWTSRTFEYPESILASDSPLRVAANKTINVAIKDDRIDSITIDGQGLDAVVLEPTPVAQLSGANRSIRYYVKLENMPTRQLQAIIAIEDQRFLEHPGFDLRSLARAVWVNLRQRAMSQGGSTITQQLVKNLLGTRQKTLFRKLRELILAILVEARYSKDTILEKYLNEVYFGQIGSLEVHGVAEAAKFFFNKPLENLRLSEMAMIAGVIRGPVVYSPYRHLNKALERKNTVLRKMEELKVITQEELQAAMKESLAFAPPVLGNNKAPYFVDYVKSQVLEQLHDKISVEDLSAQGLHVFTTLDLALQRRADQAVSKTVRELEARFKIERPLRLEGLLIAADPASGFVRALVGGRSYAETTFNRALNMKRQVGSTFKPIAYLAAFLKGQDSKGIPYSGAYMVEDTPWTYEYSGRKWTPHNYEKGYRGRITLREAFANSINIPMAKVGTDVGIDHIVDAAHRLGIEEELPEVPSLSLGSVDIKPIELLQVYSTFANRGQRVDLTTVRVITDENGGILAHNNPNTVREFEPAVIDLLNDFLKTVVKEGTAKSLPLYGYTKTARGKTGTTSFSRDAWFAGFSQGLVAVTWTGFDELKVPDDQDDEKAAENFKSPAPLTGAGAALPTWGRFFAMAKPSKLEDIEPPLDASLELKKIDRTSGLIAKPTCPTNLVYDELFLPGTAPTAFCNLH